MHRKRNLLWENAVSSGDSDEAADRYCYLACDFLGISTCFAFRLGRRVRRYKNRVPIAFFLHASRVFRE
ncbi:hypothetical protein Q1695_003715 [Nippostrongylus brasiliensis]|nr:hypothetical protein Q1695_003715 [Nippostrongylus brasiliensis]